MRAGYLGLKHCEGSERRNFSVSVLTWALTMQPKISKFLKREHKIKVHIFCYITHSMARKFPGKSSRKYGNCWISEKWSIQPKIPEIPGWRSNGTEISRKIFENLGIPHEVVLFSGVNANSQFSTQCWLVLLAAITASWTSHARMTRIR